VALQDPELDSPGALVEAVAEHLAATPDPVAAARAVGIGWGRQLASDRHDLVEILAAQGFTPEPAPDSIALRTCPLLASARRSPEVVCAIHQGLIDALSPEPLRLLPFAVPGACLIRPA
jgi:predicted ArsR family transcriptional regulator